MKRSSILTIAALVAVSAVLFVLFGAKGLTPLAALPFAFGSVFTADDAIKYLISWGFLDAAGGYKKLIRAKTADYTIVTGTDPSGTIFTNRGASGTVNFTLPAPALALAGVFYEFLLHANQIVLVKTATADTLIGLHDVDLDSVSIATASEMIGGHMVAVCDGVSWFAYVDSVGHTVTRAD